MHENRSEIKKRGVPGYIIIVLLACVGMAVYFNSLSNGFILDDFSHVVDNTAIKSFSNIPAIFTHHLTHFSGQPGRFYRPLESISFAVDHFLWGSEPFGYHLTNTLLHIFVTILVFGSIYFITGDPVVSALTGLLYLVHPVHTEAVAYISGRADPLSFIFLLLMMAFQRRYWTGGKQGKAVFYALLLLSFIAALLSKEAAVVFPFLLIFFEYCIRDRGNYRSVNIFFYVPLFLISVVWFLWKNTVIPTERMVEETVAFSAYIIALPRLLFDYIRLSIIPAGLHFSYKLEFPRSAFQAGYIEPAFFLCLLAPVIFYIWHMGKRSTGYRIAFFGIGWFIIALVPYLNIFFQLNSLFAEHWLYIPEMGFVLFVIYSVFSFASTAWARRSAIALFTAAICVFSFLTVRQTGIWKDEIAFYTYNIKHAPHTEMLYNNLAVEYMRRGDMAKARDLLLKAIKINPKNKRAMENLAIVEADAYTGQ
ncbi:MAG: tetratricopeptide repeat protein [Candidatus Omnitrophota bacterium]